MKGLGVFLYDDSADRPPGTFGCTTPHAGADQQSYLPLRFIP